MDTLTEHLVEVRDTLARQALGFHLTYGFVPLWLAEDLSWFTAETERVVET